MRNSSNFKIIKTKKIFMLVSLFLLFLLFLIFLLFKISLTIKNYGYYTHIITNTKVYDAKINNFLLGRIVFINYDNVDDDIEKLKTNIACLNKQKFYQQFGNNLKQEINNIDKKINEKDRLVEEFKTHNATLISSLSYVFILLEKINANNNITQKEKAKLIDISFDIVNLYNKINLPKNKIDNDLRYVHDIYLKYNTNNLMLMFLNVKSLSKNILFINSIDAKLKHFNIEQSLNILNQNITKIYNKNLKEIMAIAGLFFIISVILLFANIFVLIVLIKLNKEFFSFVCAVENSDNSIVITDKNRIITYVNDAFIKNANYTRKEVIGKNPRILKSGLTPQKSYDDMNKKLCNYQKWSGEFINKKKDGTIYYEKASIIPLFNEKELVGYLAIKLNITEYIKQEKKINFLINHDRLTNLKNRKSLEAEIQNYIQRAQKFGTKISILFLDIDNFKFINDSLGHEIGDLILKTIAQRIRNNLDSRDTVFRVGGDEFVIIISEDDKVLHTEAIVKRIMQLVSKPIKINSKNIQITVSIGIVQYPKDGDTSKKLLKNVDITTYNAKLLGKNRFVYFHKEFLDAFSRKIEIEQELKNALYNNEMYIVYQPKYDLKTKEILSLECLIRWKNKILGLVSPAEFIPIAEKTDVIFDIGRYTFRKSCEDFKELKKYIPTLEHVTINVSARQFDNAHIFDEFKKIIEETKMDIKYIGLEITETYMMKNIEKTKIILNQMKKFGYEIVLDDFGTGYSSMSYLRDFPIDVLKIDKTFVDDITEDSDKVKIIKAIVVLSKDFNYITVAEGIETEKQEKLLAHLGVDLGQGYVFSKPIKKEELIQKFTLK